MTNYVLAGDPVSAASRHYGTVVILATPENVQALKDAHYLDVSHGASSPNPLRAMRMGDHSGTHFTGPQSVLSPERLAQLQANYAHNKAAFDHVRQDIHQNRELLNMALNPGATAAMAAKAEALALQRRAEHAYAASGPTVERVINAAECAWAITAVHTSLARRACCPRRGWRSSKPTTHTTRPPLTMFARTYIRTVSY
ncbi:hypothetical protein [Xanthomonas sp. MUS 060]|uniref:hypothetical protein n=1 Tax=Xanthomonas sp. MUS 060 TaxID=1588031 RepID=UPI00126A7507|nr:hypothetical protein [Xanthomonas sp. MUS 060]